MGDEMNIDSKNWKARSTGYHSIALTNKKTNQTRIVSADAMPAAGTLAAMTERAFDSACREAFGE